jgi:hypothetical protein
MTRTLHVEGGEGLAQQNQAVASNESDSVGQELPSSTGPLSLWPGHTDRRQQFRGHMDILRKADIVRVTPLSDTYP